MECCVGNVMINCCNLKTEYIKWLMPFIFIIGYLFTAHNFEDKYYEYLAYTIIASISCVALLVRIELFNNKYIAVWVALLLLTFLYIIRFYWVSIDAFAVQRMLPRNSYNTMVADRSALLAAYKLSVASFASFCFSVIATLSFIQNGCINDIASGSNLHLFRIIARRSLLITLVLLIFLAYISAENHIGEMGVAPGVALPFRMKGVIFYARTVIIPLFLLSSIYIAGRGEDFITSRLGLIILLLNGVLDMLLRNSRSSFLLVILLLIFLMLSNGIKLRRTEKVVFSFLMILAFLMVPLMTEYRSFRAEYSLSHLESLYGAINSVGKNWVTQIINGIEFVLFRMPGLEAIWSIIANRGEPLGLNSINIILSKNGIAGYLTYVIHSMKETDNNLLAPGFVGWFYLVGGLPIVILGSLITGFLTVTCWRFIDIRYLRSGPVAQVYFLWMLFLAITDGALDSITYIIIIGLITMAAIEVGLRYLKRREASINANS
jgi:hypothetical protein